VNRFLTLAVTAVAGFVLVACGPAATDSSSEPSSAESAAVSQAAASSGDGVQPSFTEGAVADLEALIPDNVGDLAMQKTSTKGDEFLTSSDADPAVAKFVNDLGVSPSDISIAIGFGFSADASSSLGMFVFRASGADTNRLIAAFKEANDADRDAPLTWSGTTVGGKQVESAVDGETTYYLYAKDDVLFFLSGDPTSTEEAISGLPSATPGGDLRKRGGRLGALDPRALRGGARPPCPRRRPARHGYARPRRAARFPRRAVG
jgi:hypothetical protein